jgi:hypothetical protein
MKIRFLEGVTPRAVIQHATLASALVIAVIQGDATLAGDTGRGPHPSDRVVRHSSGQLALHTDLPAHEARAMLRRLEGTLRIAARYWHRPCDRRIVCFVVDDLTVWAEDDLPNPQARFVLQHVGGGMEILAADAQSPPQAHVYATSHRGIAEHELVHAYCLLAFGTCGPDWYKEGMAEMAYHRRAGDRAVRCSREVARLLRDGRETPIREVVEAGLLTRSIADRITEVAAPLAEREKGNLRWKPTDAALVQSARQSYHRSWALCHFLATSPNYKDRFQKLGLGYLAQPGMSFDQMFGPVEERLAFELGLFLRDVEDGYRVDLCHWDWDAPFAPLAAGESAAVRIMAARGYQPAGIVVTENQSYEYQAEGSWTTCRRHRETTADGSYFGRGSLEAVIFHDYELGKPFELGCRGSFVAPQTGKLYLRCRDDWQQLADNVGSVDVRLTLSGGE